MRTAVQSHALSLVRRFSWLFRTRCVAKLTGFSSKLSQALNYNTLVCLFHPPEVHLIVAR